MQKQIVIIISLVGIAAFIINSPQITASPALTSKNNPRHISASVKLTPGPAIAALARSANPAFVWHPAQLENSLIFPFITNESSSSSADGGIRQLKPTNLLGAEKLKIQNFANLTNQESPAATSSFICPPTLPFAVSYNLESPIHAVVLQGQKYFNACIAEQGGSNNNDLLYGANQNIDNNGKAENLSAFIPKYLPQGCHNQASNRLVTIKLAANTIKVSPIQTILAQESLVIGFQQTSAINVDCKQVCNSMLNQDCANDFDYCGNKILATFKVSGVYQQRQIHEDFCACKIYNPAWNGIYTQAVDISSATNYSNRLSDVTCSNYPTNVNPT